jgi:hypothetical protein
VIPDGLEVSDLACTHLLPLDVVKIVPRIFRIMVGGACITVAATLAVASAHCRT